MIQIHDRGVSRTAVVFSGMLSSVYLYEWENSFADLPINFVGVKDLSNKWYQSERHDLLEDIRTAVTNLRTDFLLCLGGSAGGFAALQFGRFLGADRILAICPQSACGQAKRDLGDLRWLDICEETPSADIGGCYPKAEIHYAADDELDVMHAGRLVGGTMREWPEGRHDLCQWLKRNGLLRGIVEGAIG